MNKSTLAERLQLVRLWCARASLSDFATEIGISETELSSIESSVTIPDIDLLVHYAAVANVNLNWLLLGDEKPFTNQDRLPIFRGPTAQVGYYWKTVALIMSYGKLMRPAALKEALFWIDEVLDRFDNPLDGERLESILPWLEFHTDRFYGSKANEEWTKNSRPRLVQRMNLFFNHHPNSILRDILSKERQPRSNTRLNIVS
jgi:transcriptional regulator with XRE-family HTH domain